MRVDVCIVGSGFGGSIAAWRLTELYRAAGERPNVLVLERGKRLATTDFRQSMDVDHLSDIYTLLQGQGAQVVVGNLVGGGSQVYLAASVRAPREVFERRDRRVDDPPTRRMWPEAISRRSLDPYYARAERALRVRRPTWDQVSKSGGIWAAALDAAGHTCDRVPLAINPTRCIDAKWCYAGCEFGAKNTVMTNYLGAAEEAGVEVRPLRQAARIRETSARPWRYEVDVEVIDPETRQPTGRETVQCKVLILAAGAMGTTPLLMRSRGLGGLPGLSRHVGYHLGMNGDHVAAAEVDERRLRSVLGLPRYGQFYKGRPITVMSYDWWVGKRGHRHDGTRFTLQEILLSQLTNFLYDDGSGGEGPSWWGAGKKRSIARWSDRLELLAMVEDTHDGRFFLAPPSDSHIRVNSGPLGIATFSYSMSERALAVREAADRAIRRVVERRGLGRFLKLTQTEGVYAAHPLGGCRMADTPDLGVVDADCQVFGYEGLYCMDSSVIPSSLGVNPSLTIAAVCERAAERLVARAGDLGLPSAEVSPHRAPREKVGPRVVSDRERARIRAARRRARLRRQRRRRRARR